MALVLFPLAAAVLYAVGSLLLKRSLADGVGAWRTTFVCNVLLAALAAPLLAFAPAPSPEAAWYQPVVSGTTFFLGQVFTFLALNRGDVSVATPVLGTKVIFVAFLSVLLIHLKIAWTLWLAALLTTVALALLGGGHLSAAARRKFVSTALYAGLSALAFSVTDVTTQKWCQPWGTAAFVPRFLGVCALLSLGLIPFFSGRLRDIGAASWRWLLGGAFLLGLQGLMLYVVIGHYGHATEVNVIYNSRGLWTIVLVWAAGSWFANTENREGRGAMAGRLAGSVLLLAAIVLVVR